MGEHSITNGFDSESGNVWFERVSILGTKGVNASFVGPASRQWIEATTEKAMPMRLSILRNQREYSAAFLEITCSLT